MHVVSLPHFGQIARCRPSMKVTNLVQSLLYDIDKPVRSHALHWGRENEGFARITSCQYQNANGHSNLSTQLQVLLSALTNLGLAVVQTML